jgi:Na+-translocating ferredoxin:NAD+ oxidoreductase RnfG subunit
MTVKQFFKSNTLKCLLVLTCIALVSGGLLAIFNDVLYISDEEQLNRAIAEIYGTTIGYEEFTVNEADSTNEYGSIDSVYKLDDGNYLIKSTGIDGYKNGTVTAWVVIGFTDGAFSGINDVTLESYDKQTLMSQMGDSFYSVFTSEDNQDEVLEGQYFYPLENDETIQNVVTGATYSSNAFDNAVNSSLYYVRTVLNKEGE